MGAETLFISFTIVGICWEFTMDLSSGGASWRQSIGKEACRKLTLYSPDNLYQWECDESQLYHSVHGELGGGGRSDVRYAMSWGYTQVLICDGVNAGRLAMRGKQSIMGWFWTQWSLIKMAWSGWMGGHNFVYSCVIRVVHKKASDEDEAGNHMGRYEGMREIRCMIYLIGFRK